MINFTVGPVQICSEVSKIGGEQVPYFRTKEFSEIMLENERLMLELSNAPINSRSVFMTCSGTGSMEATIINTLNDKDKVIVVNGGSFGERFEQLLSMHSISHESIVLKRGEALKSDDLKKYDNKGFTSFVVNLHETSTGVLYDINLISEFCKRNDLFLIVDSISSFLADPFDMSASCVDVLITGSQKALACPPGVSIIVLSPKAIDRVNSNKPSCLYLNLSLALENQERGQTPFTPAVGILRQINYRLKQIHQDGGARFESEKIGFLASYFRKKIKDYPFDFFSKSMSNAVTSLRPRNGVSAYDIFLILKNEYDIWVCPNGGALKNSVFRVGHIGCLTTKDYDVLFSAFDDMIKRGLL